MLDSPISRRRFLALTGMGGLAVVSAACGRSEAPGPNPAASPPAPGSIAALKAGAQAMSMFQAQSELVAGPTTFTFGLVTEDGRLISGGSPPVFLALDERSRALGPFAATSFTMDAFQKYQNEAPVTELTSFYAVDVDVPQPGEWLFAAVVVAGDRRAVGTTTIRVVATPSVAPLGSKAMSTPSPVAKTPAKLEEICTRRPPDPMHAISLDDALANGKPTVVTFGTPLLCEARVCGPVTDEVLAVRDSVGDDAANFIHVEEFLPGPDLEPPPPSPENQAPAFKAWGFQTEPWTFVIDKGGIIRARFEGPVVASQVTAALQPLL